MSQTCIAAIPCDSAGNITINAFYTLYFYQNIADMRVMAQSKHGVKLPACLIIAHALRGGGHTGHELWQ